TSTVRAGHKGPPDTFISAERERDEEPVDQLGLRAVDLFTRFVRLEPGTAIHLRVRAPPSRSSRPLDLHLATANRIRVGIALPGPGVHCLPRLLPDAAQRQERPPRNDSGLLLELSARRFQRILSLLDYPLGDSPRTQVA